MNKGIRLSFDRITAAATAHRETVLNALEKYAADKEKAELLKDPAGPLATAKANARNAISRSEAQFSASVGNEVTELKKELAGAFTAPCGAVVETLRLHRDFALPLTRSETEALIEVNGGNLLGLSLIGKTLTDTKTALRVESPALTAYEDDIAALERLAAGNQRYTPLAMLHEASEVWGGSERMRKTKDGTAKPVGTWNTLQLSMSSADFDSAIASLSEAADRWSGSIMPTLAQIDLYKDKNEEGVVVSKVEQLDRDRKAVMGNATTQHDNHAEQMDSATVFGKQRAAADRLATDVLTHYGA